MPKNSQTGLPNTRSYVKKRYSVDINHSPVFNGNNLNLTYNLVGNKVYDSRYKGRRPQFCLLAK